jgi:hypothetical protein
MSRAALALVILAAAVGCGPASVRPVSFPDPEVLCPGGRQSWTLQILDQRAERKAEDRVVGPVRDAIQKSFPGCRWSGSEQAEQADTITIEIHRLASVYDQGSWEAAAEWSVSAREAGRTLIEFEVNEEVSRPNYQASDNEKESLSEAFRRGVERTVKGLSTISNSGQLRPPEGTPAVASANAVARLYGSNPMIEQGFSPRPVSCLHVARMEWISQSTTPEDL